MTQANISGNTERGGSTSAAPGVAGTGERNTVGGGKVDRNGKALGGSAPGGMWWVAWRQHRAQVAISLALLALLAVTFVAFRVALTSRLQEVGGGDYARCLLSPASDDSSTANCPYEAFDAVYADFTTLWGLLRLGMIAAPVVLGAFVGAPLFAREFEQHTQVFALTQSIGRMRWWTTKVVVAATPVVLAMIGVGMLMEWTAAPFAWISSSPMSTPAFETRGIVPAGFTLLTIAIGVTAGIVLRSTVIGLATTIIVAGIVIGALGALRPYLLSHERVVTPIESASGSSSFYPDGQSWVLDSGYLEATGTPVDFNGSCPAMSVSTAGLSDEAYDDLWMDCLRGQGITGQYIDYLPTERRTTLQLTVTGISTILAALILAAGAFRLHRRVL